MDFHNHHNVLDIVLKKKKKKNCTLRDPRLLEQGVMVSLTGCQEPGRERLSEMAAHSGRASVASRALEIPEYKHNIHTSRTTPLPRSSAQQLFELD